MVLGRRHWIVITLALVLLFLLTACERPLGSNEGETAEQAAEATAVAETETGEENVASSVEDQAGSATEPGEETGTESAGEAVEEAEASDSNVGGGTPETAAEEASAAAESAEEASTAEEPSGEATTEDAATEMSGETTDEETASQEAGAAAEEDASEATAEQSVESEVTESEEETTAAEADSTTATTTLPATHTVAVGENLYRIGLKYGMSWVVLAAYNHLPNANYIRMGQVLQIPGGGTPGPSPTPTPPDETGHIDYVVQRGDTLNKIGQRFGVSWVEIAEANGLVNPNLIYAGQVLKIPTTAPEVPPAVTHTVKPGETLYRISLQYGIHWLAIAQTNNIAPPYVIYPGQVLALPGG